MEEIQFYPLDVDNAIINGKDYIRVFGRTTKNEKVCIFEEFEDYFFVISTKRNVEWVKRQIDQIKAEDENKRIVYIKRTELQTKKFLGKEIKVIKVVLNSSKDLIIISEALREIPGYGGRKEADIPLYKKYLIEKQITPLALCKAKGENIDTNLEVDICLKGKVTQLSEDLIKDVKILSFDIETADPYKPVSGNAEPPIVMIGLAGNDGFRKCIVWKKFENFGKEIEFANDEAELLLKFRDTIKGYKPDFIVGYFSDGFDWPYIKSRADFLKISLDLGLDGSKIRFNQKGNKNNVKISGIPHIDVFRFVKQVMSGDVASGSLQTQSHSLNSVAEEILGERKMDADIFKLQDAWKKGENLKEFCEYNLKDAELCLKIFEKILPNITELVKVVSQPIYDVSKMTFGQLIESYLMKKTREFNEIIPGKPGYREKENRSYDTYTGGFVYEPKPGLYENLAVFDFRGLHPSIISAHNICVSTLTKDKKDAKETPEIDGKTYYFSYKEEGFIPKIVKELIERRIRIKEIIKKQTNKDPVLKARNYALKIIAAGFHGYLGYAGARWYNLECASGVLAYARYYVKKLISEAEKFGFGVIYSDTDSCFCELKNKTKKEALEFLREFNTKLPSLMELELEDFYERGIFVGKKNIKAGAKKRYALINEKGDIKVRGFEAVRRDWSGISKEIQNNVLKMVLKDKNMVMALNYVKEKINEIKNKKLSIESMIIRTQLKKNIEDYDNIGPHVAVARQMLKKGIKVSAGSVISYVITEGEGLIRDKARLVEDAKNYDAEYYITHQVLPAVENIFEVLGYKKEDLLNEGSQVKLGEF